MKRNKGTNAIRMLKEDHKKVKELFEKFEDSEDSREKRQVAKSACAELLVHSKLEEEIFYPAAKGAIEEKDLVAEAKEEHHVVEQLISELESSDLDEEAFNAKFYVLSESVRHHIKEEEGELFPEVEDADLNLEELGRRMEERKRQLEQEVGAELVSAHF